MRMGLVVVQAASAAIDSITAIRGREPMPKDEGAEEDAGVPFTDGFRFALRIKG
jgi:hypothetical protein